MILKVVRPLPGREAPERTFYWRREAAAYGSGLLDRLTADLEAPRCYGAEERAGPADRGGRELWLWLEDAQRAGAVMANAWTADQVVDAARRYGGWNGAYLAGVRPLPAQPWVAHGLWRPWVAEAAPGVARLAALRGHPAVRAGFPDGLDAAVLRFWEEDREPFLAALERLPPALQHGDASAGNMFFLPAGRGGAAPPPGPGGAGGRPPRLMAIDFAFLAVAPIGLELAVLLNSFRAKAPGGDEAAFAARLSGAYVAGLRAAGWAGDARLVGLGWRLATALRYLLNPHVFALLDEREYARMARSRGLPVDDYRFLEVAARVLRRARDIAAEAREQLRRL